MELYSDISLEYLKEIEMEALPTWCNTDLRDVNKVLMNPLKCDDMLELYNVLYSLGVREMAVGDIRNEETKVFIEKISEITRTTKDVTFVVEVPSDIDDFKCALPYLKMLPNVILDQVWITEEDDVESFDMYKGFDLSFKLFNFEEEISEGLMNECSSIAERFPDNKVLFYLPLDERSLPHIFGSRIYEFKKGLPKNAKVGLYQFNRMLKSPYHGEYAYIGGVNKFKGSFFVNDDLRKLIIHFEERGLNSGLDTINLPEKDVLYEKLTGQNDIKYLLENQCGIKLPTDMQTEVEKYIKEQYKNTREDLTVEWVFRTFESAYILDKSIFSCEDITFNEESGCMAEFTLAFVDERQKITGSGNGRLQAISNAIQQYFGISFQLSHYESHSLSSGFSAKVLCTVGVSYDGVTYWGAGMNQDLLEASINALTVAINSIPKVMASHLCKDKRMVEILNFIERNYNVINLKILSDEFFLSEPYLSKYIKEETGTTFGKIVKRIRMNKARNMLKNSTMTVEKISGRVGYNNVEHFNRLFKKIYGITPTQFRNL